MGMHMFLMVGWNAMGTSFADAFSEAGTSFGDEINRGMRNAINAICDEIYRGIRTAIVRNCKGINWVKTC